MAGEDENTCQKFIFMMIIFFLIVLMVAGFTVAIIFTLKKKTNTCTRTCMEGDKCTCSKCTSRCNSETLYTNPNLLHNEKLGSDCGCENDGYTIENLEGNKNNKKFMFQPIQK